MKKKKLGINAILNMAKTVMGMAFPLITYPYIARILQVENVGRVNYANSIVNYFILFAMLGIKVYSTREGAQIRNDPQKLQRFVSEIYSINILTGTIAGFLLFLSVIFVDVFIPYRNLILIIGLGIPLTVFGADWINSIFEDYLYITIRTIFFQLIALIFIFVFVKEKNDYLQYAFSIVISGYGAGILNLFYTRRYCRKHFTLHLGLKKHFKPIILLFTTNLASQIYSSADTVMLGLMTTDYNVGIYGTAAKIYNIFKQLLFAIVVVCLPRFSYMLANEDKKEYERFANKIYNIVFILSLPLVMGIFSLSDSVINIIAGEGYSDAIITLKIKCFAILFAIFAYFYMQLVLIPAKKDAAILKATLVAGGFNVITNYFLIPYFLENGAAFTTVCSELIVYIVTKMMAKKIIVLCVEKKVWFQTITATTIMVISITLINRAFLNSIIKLVTGFVVGILCYFGTMVLLKNETVLWGVKVIKCKLNKK